MQLKNLGDDSITLISDNMVWTDEFTFNQVEADELYTLAGTYVTNVSPLKLGGRTITLEQQDAHGFTYGNIKTLYDLAAIPNQDFELSLHDGRVFKVFFDSTGGSPVAGEPLTRLHPMPDSHLFKNVILKFKVIE